MHLSGSLLCSSHWRCCSYSCHLPSTTHFPQAVGGSLLEYKSDLITALLKPASSFPSHLRVKSNLSPQPSSPSSSSRALLSLHLPPLSLTLLDPAAPAFFLSPNNPHQFHVSACATAVLSSLHADLHLHSDLSINVTSPGCTDIPV